MLASLSAANRATLTGRSFFPHLISAPFRTGLHEAFLFAIVACLIAAGASLMRGGRYHYVEPSPRSPSSTERTLADAGSRSAAETQPGAGELARTTTAEEQHAR